MVTKLVLLIEANTNNQPSLPSSSTKIKYCDIRNNLQYTDPPCAISKQGKKKLLKQIIVGTEPSINDNN